MNKHDRKQIVNEKYFRDLVIKREHVNEDARTVELAFSSEEPYERWFGFEVLDHSPGAIDLQRLESSGPLLLDHNPSDHIGVIESVSVGSDRRGRAVVRFSRSEKATEIFNDVVDGIRKSVSVGYRVHDMDLEKKSDEGPDTYRVTRWQPLEISLVSIPADHTVGVGRSDDPEKGEVKQSEDSKDKSEIIKNTKEDLTMSEEKKAPAAEKQDIDVTAIRDQARKDELDRVRNIQLIGEKMNNADLARQFVENGKSIDAFRAALLETMGEAAPFKAVDDDGQIGMDESEKRQFSFMRAINALANPSDRKAQEAAAFEWECSRAAAEKYGKDPQGLMIPLDVLKRDLTVGTATAGGHTVATDLLSGSFIEKLDNAMALVNAGVMRLNGLSGNIAIPRATGGATAYWVAESNAITESQQAFDQVTMSPETVGAFTDISRKLLLQSSMDVEAFVENDLALRLALEIDRVGINGSGASNQPTGILQTAGIGSVIGGTNGAAPDWADIVDLESAVANANAALGSLGYLTNTKVRGKLKQTEKFSGTNGNPVYADGDTPLNGYRTIISNQVPSDLDKGTSTGVCSAIIFGNFADLIIGMWGGLDLTVDPYTNSTSGTVRVVALQDVDVAVRHAESFAAMADALTA